MRRRICACCLLLTAFAAAAAGNERYDPRLRFRTISTPRFDIHFHQGQEPTALRLASLAEEVAREMEPRLGRPRARVNVIVVDQTDLANGWATPIPYNLIEIVAASPRAESFIGNTSDWLKLVFTHEYTHVLHLERSRGWLGALGRPFGRVPIFYPNQFLPPPLIEGLATHAESAVTREGRVPAGDFRLLVDRAAASKRFLSLSEASNAIVGWPSGQAPYAYGAYFYDYLARTHGEASLERFANETAGKLPFFGVRAFRRVFGKPLGDLWDDFQRETETRARTAPPQGSRLTRHGFNVAAPWHAPDGRLYYSIANPHAFPALMELSPQGPRQVATRVFLGGRLGGTTDEIVFDQVDYVRSVALQSDLYAVHLSGGRVRRITRGARAADPHVSPDGKTIACVLQRPAGRALATLPLTAGAAASVPAVLAGEANVDYASPRWSPDGRRIAAERRESGSASEIVVVDGSTGVIERRFTGGARSRSASPAWSPDGRLLLFASATGAAPFQIHAADLETNTVKRLANAGDSAQSPAVSPDGRTLVFVGYTADGFDLFSMPLGTARWEESSPVAPENTREPVALAAQSPSTRISDASPYNAFRTLMPRFWTPVIEAEDERLSVGAATGGVDALGRHSYLGSAAWSTRGRPDWYVAYAYDRWRPTIFAEISDDTDRWRSGEVRVREVNAGALLRVRRVRRVLSLFGSFHAATEAFDCPACDSPVDVMLERRALRAAIEFDTSRRFGYSISDEEGFFAAIATELTRQALGATGDATSVIVEGGRYLAFGPRHAVLAARGAAASSWGDRRVRREFAAGGAGPQSSGFDFDLDAVALLRGFDTGDVSGRRAAVVNVDYRIPIAWIERGSGTWPLFARSIHGAVFADAGAAWNSRLARNSRRASLGAELSADVVLGYSLPLTAAAGVAWRHDPTGRSRGAALFARLGRAF